MGVTGSIGDYRALSSGKTNWLMSMHIQIERHPALLLGRRAGAKSVQRWRLKQRYAAILLRARPRETSKSAEM